MTLVFTDTLSVKASTFGIRIAIADFFAENAFFSTPRLESTLAVPEPSH